MPEKQELTVGNAVHHTQGIKPSNQEEYFDFDEENSPYSEDQMASFIKNNVEDGDKVELVVSPDNEGKFTEINLRSNSNGGSESNDYSDDYGEFNRQSAFKSVAGMWDEKPSGRKEYNRFKAMVKDAEAFIENGEFTTGEDEIFVYEEKEKVQRNDSEEGKNEP